MKAEMYGGPDDGAWRDLPYLDPVWHVAHMPEINVNQLDLDLTPGPLKSEYRLRYGWQNNPGHPIYDWKGFVE